MRALKKKPIQIYIESKQDLLLESNAKRKKTSKAQIIGLSIDSYLSNLPVEKDPVLGIIGLGRSGEGDISEKHDIHFARHISGRTKRKQ